MSCLISRPAEAYFDAVAPTYDQIFTETIIGRAERDAVWLELKRLFRPGQRILELNCGTGVDAFYMGQRGVKMLACDISPRMIEVARRRLDSPGLRALVEFRVLATEDIATLSCEGPFDGAFSNFDGFNVLQDRSGVPRILARLLRPRAQVLLCVKGRFVPWEIAWHVAHGDPRKIMRPFRREGVVARPTGDVPFRVYYPSVATLAREFAPEFRLRHWRGIGVVMPPCYFESWAERYPKSFGWLAKADRWFSRPPLLRSMAGHALLQFERREE
jgi:SAM-dependent methyltransferase